MRKLALVLSLIFIVLSLAVACTPAPLSEEEKQQLIQDINNKNNYQEIITTDLTIDAYSIFEQEKEYSHLWRVENNRKIAMANGISGAIKKGERLKVKLFNVSKWYQWEGVIVMVVSLDTNKIYLDFEIGRENLVNSVLN